MKLSANLAVARRSSQNGFSLVELVLTLAVLLLITTLAVPVILRSLQSYQLNSTASQLAGLLKFAKFEAIRQNTPIACQIQGGGTNWLVWVDSNGDSTPSGAEPRMIVGGSFSLLPASAVPDTTPITQTLGAATGTPWTVLGASNTSEWYDHRGVLCFQTASVCPAPPVTIYAFFVGNPNDPTAGYRAIITLPSGAVQVWSAGSNGPWQRVS